MLNLRLLAWLFVLASLDGLIGYAHDINRRYKNDNIAPPHYRFSWGIDGKRCSYATASGQYLGRSTIKGAQSVTQSVVNLCASECDQTLGCGFFHPVEMTGSSVGNVVCALYTTKISKSAATYSSGPESSGGSVVASYGYTREKVNSISASAATTTSSAAATSSSLNTISQTTASMDTSSESSTSETSRSTDAVTQTISSASTSSDIATTMTSMATSSAVSTFPAPPPGARLVQFPACKSSRSTIPMFVNKQYPSSKSSSSADTAWIVQHGLGRDFDGYFTSVYNVVGDSGILIAPNFYARGDTPAPNSWFQPSRNFAWHGNDWSMGNDAVAPSGNEACSSFDVYDDLIDSLRNKSKYPNLKHIFVVAHSRGSAMTARYGMLSSNTDLRYVLANAPVMTWFTSDRPVPSSTCSGYNSWAYGWAGTLPRYVQANSPGPIHAFRKWVSLDITWMTGDLDTYSRDQTGDQSCMVQSQGGQNRRDRGYAFWAYINLLAGTRNNVSKYYGYDALRAQVKSVSASVFKVRNCVVDGVAHDNFGMFASDCGRAAIRGAATLPAGPGPIRPP